MALNLSRLALQDSHKGIVKTLKVDSEVLDNIHGEFVKVAIARGIRIHSFQEGRGMSGVRGLHGKVVSDFSSKLDLPNIETIEGLDLDHRQMARCKDRSDENYRVIVRVLKQDLKRESSSTDLPIRSVQLTHQEQRPSASQETGTACATPPYYQLPPRNRRFIGRTEKLKELEEKLIISSDCQKLALVGLGGIGKSQVALELAYAVKERWPDRSILWVPAVSRETFEQAYKEIASHYSIVLDPKKEDTKESVRRHLNSKSAGKWLLVVDNADDEVVLFGKPNESKGMTEYLPKSESGLTLFTSRHRKIAVSLASKDVVEIQEMNDKEAETFLGESLDKKIMLQDRAVTAEILNELTRLPLAISQAAAYLNVTLRSLQEYLSLLKNTEQETISLLSHEFCDDTRYPNSEQSRNAVAATWLVSFDHLRQSEPDAADLLSFMSCIEHKAIPQPMLPKFELKERMVYALGMLRAYAFITQRGDDENYDMHRLVHLGTKVWLGKHSTTDDWNTKAAVHFAEIFPPDDYSNQATWRAYLPHAIEVLRNTKPLDIEARYDLCLYVGRCLRVDGRIEEAVGWLSQCFVWRCGRCPEDHPSRLASQHELAKAYLVNGRFKEAVELLEQVVAIRRETLAKDHPDRLASLNELAIAYRTNGQINEAIEILKYVVAIRKKVLAEDHPGRLASQHNLAVVYWDNGQDREAVELLEHVVAIRREVLREDHRDRVASQYQLAVTYASNGQMKKAIQLLEYVVAIDKKVLAENHPDRLASLHRLAVVYYDDGQIEKAVELLEHVVIMKRQVLAEDHPSRLLSERVLSKMYAKQRSKHTEE
ncbi:MAG: hypothetical protein OHK93_000097 [Ramalina farinacea]|uniref:NB-ARC domain-containing protein n=1 Tax=Ramalina farinacea TaxID=258253 RepID=A0AA43QE96_9LECA|nr:hypothetical protein [Ramalina farinacea]